LLHNQNWDFAIWPTVAFNVANVMEVDPVSGEETAVLDDSPYMPGLQLSFGVAEARLFALTTYSSEASIKTDDDVLPLPLAPFMPVEFSCGREASSESTTTTSGGTAAAAAAATFCVNSSAGHTRVLHYQGPASTRSPCLTMTHRPAP
jgi:hypothetical protein